MNLVRTEHLKRELRTYLFQEEKKLKKTIEHSEETKEVDPDKDESVEDFADNSNHKGISNEILFEVIGAVLRFLGLWAACCLIMFVLVVLELALQGQIQW